jgi:hypothetical protein
MLFSGFITSSEITIQRPMIQDIESRLTALYDYGMYTQDYDCLLAITAFKNAASELDEVVYMRPKVREYLVRFGLADENGLLKSDYLIVWRLHRGSLSE